MVGRGLGVLAGAAALAVTGTALGVGLQRRILSRGEQGAIAASEPFFSLRSHGPVVQTPDGVALHTEVDLPIGPVPDDLTVVLVHGYALTLDCWHFQRKFFADRARVVLYDQRSHGRSTRSAPELCRVPQLAQDLAQVLDEVVGTAPVVLIGHSMGGMTIMELARQRPDWFGPRIRGVGLCATSSGDLADHSLVRAIPGRTFARITPPLLSTLSRVPRLVRAARRAGTDLGWVITKRMAFGAIDVPASYVDFLVELLDQLPLEVVADFYPAFAELDEQAALEVLASVEAAVIGGRSDVITPVTHTERIIEALPGADALVLEDCGHLGILERHEEINRVLGDLVDRARRPLGG